MVRACVRELLKSDVDSIGHRQSAHQDLQRGHTFATRLHPRVGLLVVITSLLHSSSELRKCERII
jgi:hypothetical protein